VAAGIPMPRDDHAEATALLALEMQRVWEEFVHRAGLDLEIRIGINSGPVVAGVIGKRRFLYDLWGDAVNTASRMESYGVPGEIQVTETTYALLKDRFAFEERGVIEVKGKGPMRTYFLHGPLPRDFITEAPRPAGAPL
jgi:class 3 adenylate cyclase